MLFCHKGEYFTIEEITSQMCTTNQIRKPFKESYKKEEINTAKNSI